jgi:hypothetical protein
MKLKKSLKKAEEIANKLENENNKLNKINKVLEIENRVAIAMILNNQPKSSSDPNSDPIHKDKQVDHLIDALQYIIE